MFLYILVGLNFVKPLNDLLSTAFKTLTNELSAVGEKHYQREIVLLVSALVLVWRRCLHVR